ncbi:prolyl oligopeptidase family serine peptidase [Sphingobacterium hotanense]|uniref:prolyl oligopeptidase family serine peptidase n=1 Tax=Sphingobacterium hotanense TaxID=649196 RepID=UPI0021A914B3|nr:prolyl oligopeptidase family serine peptidase [Sphingobacterium hotanense]MCT1526039.1 prolyl oligopeptidase family serine peptidase [Sphingobacterium hotanense]
MRVIGLIISLTIWLTSGVSAKPIRLITNKDTLFHLKGREVYIAFPPKINPKNKVLFAFHGSGREARSYVPGDARSNSFYIKQRDLAVKENYIFIVISFGQDIWAINQSAVNFLSIRETLLKEYDLADQWTVWASSAGAVLFANVLKLNPKIFDKAIGTFPVFDLHAAMQRVKSARDLIPVDQLENLNPANFYFVFNNLPYLIFHGDQDEAVPIELHSLYLKKLLKSNFNKVKVQKVKGGHSTSNWHLYDETKISKFL